MKKFNANKKPVKKTVTSRCKYFTLKIGYFWTNEYSNSPSVFISFSQQIVRFVKKICTKKRRIWGKVMQKAKRLIIQLSLVTTPRENSENYDEYGENPYDTYDDQYDAYGEGQGPR